MEVAEALEETIREEACKRGLTVRRLSWAEADQLKKEARERDFAEMESARKEGNVEQVGQELQAKNSAFKTIRIIDWRPPSRRI